MTNLQWPDRVYAALRRLAPQYRFVDRSPADRALREVVAGLVRPGMRVLDVGCGTGVMACHIAATGAADVDYLGIDPDADACRVARAILAEMPPGTVRGEVVTQTLDDCLRTQRPPVDLLVAIRALHECLDPADPASLSSRARQLAKRLEANGRVLICEPVTAPHATPDERARIEAYGRCMAGDGGNPHLNADEIRSVFLDAGYSLEAEREGERLILGRHLGLQSARYCLFLFRFQGRS